MCRGEVVRAGVERGLVGWMCKEWGGRGICLEGKRD